MKTIIIKESQLQLIKESAREEQLITEMARVGYLKDYEIIVWTNDGGNIPHFHIIDRETRGEKFHTCIQYKVPEYFHHTGKEDILNNREIKELINFFNKQCDSKKFNVTNWELAVFLWNKNNSTQNLDEENTPMPDYLHLNDKI
jgi:hypothetical protein